MVPARSVQAGIITSHVHLIIGTSGNKMEDILRDFKSFTSRSLKSAIQEHPAESRRECLPDAGGDVVAHGKSRQEDNNNNDYQFWQQDNHPIELWDNYVMDQKFEYLHMNPVLSGFVDRSEAYLYSGARDYAGEKGLLDIQLIQ